MTEATCRFCQAPLKQVFADLGSSPLANSNLSPDQLWRMEPHFPLVVYVCGECFLVQARDFETPEAIFSDYQYFSSYSELWLEHCRRYADAMVRRWKLGPKSCVVEVASNDGYLLQYFKAKGIPVLGIEPAQNIAEVARKKGIPTEAVFFGKQTAQALAERGYRADLIAANNVLAHVPDINGFVAGFKALLKPDGVITVEYPHFLNLLNQVQFDTIYHEHFSYLSLTVVEKIFAQHGLRVFDVEELPTHGGSLRVYACHAADGSRPAADSVSALLERERLAGLQELATYERFQDRIERVKVHLLQFLIRAWEAKKSVVGYGAPAKGNTLLNYCGVGKELVRYTVDLNPHKAGRYLPGCRLPIHHPDRIKQDRPDYVLILPWNLKSEIEEQMKHVREWGGKFVIAIPEIRVS